MRTLRLDNQNGQIDVYVTEGPSATRGTLVCVHGGPGGDHRGNDGIFDQIAQYGGAMGFSIVQFDMFGAGRSAASAAAITLQSQHIDYESVLRYAMQHLPTPCFVIGESMGATIAALEWNSAVAGHVLLWPAFDLKDTDLQPYFGDQWREVLGRQGFLEDSGMTIGRKFLEEIQTYDFAPCFHLPKSRTLIIHGKGDKAVPFSQSLRAVAQGDGQCVLCAHPTGDHGLQRPEEREFVRRAIVWWLSEL